MRKHNKSIIFAAAIAVAAALITLAANYKALTLPTLGEWRAAGIGVAQLKAFRVDGAYPATGTVIISRISADSAVTNTLISATATNGVTAGVITDPIFMLDGDRLLRSGTATNTCQVVLILE